MKAQLDENLPPGLAQALNCIARVHDHEIIHVLDIVDRGTSDVDLFAAATAHGVQVHITQDNHNRRQIEREAIAKSGLIVFVLAKGWASLSYYDKAARLIEWWPRIVDQADLITPPDVFRIPAKKVGKGRFERVKITK